MNVSIDALIFASIVEFLQTQYTTMNREFALERNCQNIRIFLMFTQPVGHNFLFNVCYFEISYFYRKEKKQKYSFALCFIKRPLCAPENFVVRYKFFFIAQTQVHMPVCFNDDKWSKAVINQPCTIPYKNIVRARDIASYRKFKCARNNYIYNSFPLENAHMENRKYSNFLTHIYSRKKCVRIYLSVCKYASGYKHDSNTDVVRKGIKKETRIYESVIFCKLRVSNSWPRAAATRGVRDDLWSMGVPYSSALAANTINPYLF